VSPALQPGEIVLDHATRSFSIRADQAGTLRGWLMRQRASEPARIPALQDVSLHVRAGETVGMVGRNGAGKTSTLRVLAGIVPLQSGSARCGGRVVSLLELAAGFSRDFSGRENILLQGALFGFDRAQITARIDQIIAFSELGEFIDAPVKTYSQGMFLRLGFSIAAHLDADVMLIDEVLAVGDEAFQRKCLRRISEQIAAGATLLLVSHELGSIERVCERVVVIDHGRLVFDGPTTEGLLRYRELMGTEHGGGESVRPVSDAPVQITDLELRDASGRTLSVVRTGAPLAVYMELSAAVASRVRLELRVAGGSVLFTTAFEVAAGTAALAYEIPSLPLLAGDYDLALGAGPELQRSTRFSVTSEHAEAGVIDLRGSWRVLSGSPTA
jgi:ABC-type polysaccharide/polyol phosphate transport system ATPase subunit